MNLHIRRATQQDIPLVEDILYDVTDYFEKIGDPQWKKNDITWAGLERYFKIEDFYISFFDEKAVGCMAVLDHDPTFWPNIPKGSSLYIHKLAVKREFAGKGFATEMIDFVKAMSVELNINEVHLDCHKSKIKLRQIYENEGFVFVKEDYLFGDYYAAFFEWKHHT